MHRQQLLGLLARHRTPFMEEAAYIDRSRAFVEMHPDCFHCDLWPAHVTGSAWVVNPDCSRVLLVHHRKHDQWFQPGGHADGEADIVAVALRETSEESGIDADQIRLVNDWIFDLDIHRIPASHRGPEHDHIDVRFLVEIDDRLPVPGSDESHDVRWVPLGQVSRFNNNRSTYRMVQKTRSLRPRGAYA
ncbi:MAG: NUDIX hydrolase [Gammaproteobacteria bacterium]|jgi:8-oxo-dGTP pyrophosphatase MutT (NUDIX family)